MKSIKESSLPHANTKKYHFVILFDEETQSFSIDWETGHHRFDGQPIWDDRLRRWEEPDYITETYQRYEQIDKYLQVWVEKTLNPPLQPKGLPRP